MRNEEHSSIGEFATRQLSLATFLIAADLLPFSRLEPTVDQKLRFVFDDKDRLGPRFALELERGAKAQVRSIFAAQTFCDVK
jgi:hypothetical protein